MHVRSAGFGRRRPTSSVTPPPHPSLGRTAGKRIDVEGWCGPLLDPVRLNGDPVRLAGAAVWQGWPAAACCSLGFGPCHPKGKKQRLSGSRRSRPGETGLCLPVAAVLNLAALQPQQRSCSQPEGGRQHKASPAALCSQRPACALRWVSLEGGALLPEVVIFLNLLGPS